MRTARLKGRSPRVVLLIAALIMAGCALGVERAEQIHRSETFRDQLVPSPAEQPAEPQPDLDREEDVTLAACIRFALDNSEALRIQAERILDSEIQKAEAISTILPQVSGRYQYTHDAEAVSFEGRDFTPQKRSEYWFSLRQSVFKPEFLPALQAADHVRAIETLGLKDLRDRLVFTVASEFYTILSIEKDVAALEATVEGAREQHRVLSARLEAGEATEQEVLATKAAMEQARAALIEARKDQEATRARLRELTGLPVLPQHLVDDYSVAHVPGEVPQLVSVALAGRQDLEVARRRVDLANSERDLALSRYLPSADATFDLWTHREGGFLEQNDWTLTLGVDWQLFDGGAREASLARAKSSIRRAELDLSRLEKRVRREVEEAVLAFSSFEDALVAFEARAEAATGSYERAVDEFEVGEATNREVLLAREAREDALRALARARFGRKLAALRIHLAVGDLHRTVPVRAAIRGEP